MTNTLPLVDHNETDPVIENAIRFLGNRIRYGQTFEDIVNGDPMIVETLGGRGNVYLYYKAAEILVSDDLNKNI